MKVFKTGSPSGLILRPLSSRSEHDRDPTEVQKSVKESMNLSIAGVPLILQIWTKEITSVVS